MKTIEAVVETPKGSAVKYDYDRATGLFTIKKALPAGMVFPFDFGFVPNTKGEDGDPLDIIMISEFFNYPGCKLECRVIGCLMAEQKDQKGGSPTIRNDRYLAVPKISKLLGRVTSIKDLPEEMLKELEIFFIQYNKVEKRKFRIVAKKDSKAALRMLKDAIKLPAT